MGNCLSFSKKAAALSKQELIEMGKAAQRERDQISYLSFLMQQKKVSAYNTVEQEVMLSK